MAVGAVLMCDGVKGRQQAVGYIWCIIKKALKCFGYTLSHRNNGIVVVAVSFGGSDNKKH